jgi:predicted metal-dependent hydrolase
MHRKVRRRRGRNVPFNVTYRNIKYPRLELKTGSLVVVLPKNGYEPEKIIERHRKWIENKIEFIEDCLRKSRSVKLEARDVRELREVVRYCIERHEKTLDVRVHNVYIRRMKSKWASCSRKRNLTVNTSMRYLPQSLIEYIVYHEMVHIIERKHNERFWKIVKKEYNNYSEYERELFVYWFKLNPKNKQI